MEEKGALERDQQAYSYMTIARLLNAHIAAVNSERQALWLGYAAMLLANALLYGFFIQLQAPTTLQAAFATGFGWAFCMTWLILTISSFRQFMLQLDTARDFARLQLAAINRYANPVNIEEDIEPLLVGFESRRPRGNRLRFLTMIFVIFLFMFAYAFWFTHHLYYIFVFFEGPR
jgi:hypothetical protein